MISAWFRVCQFEYSKSRVAVPTRLRHPLAPRLESLGYDDAEG